MSTAIIDELRSAFDATTTHLTIRRVTTSTAELPRWGTPRHQSLRSPAQAIPAKVKKLYLAAAARYRVPWQLLAAIGKRPVLEFDMRLGEGSGAALALGIVRAALACHNGMATFGEAGVSEA